MTTIPSLGMVLSYYDTLSITHPRQKHKLNSKIISVITEEHTQISLNKFFDPSALSMRKVDDGKKEYNVIVIFSGH